MLMDNVGHEKIGVSSGHPPCRVYSFCCTFVELIPKSLQKMLLDIDIVDLFLFGISVSGVTFSFVTGSC